MVAYLARGAVVHLAPGAVAYLVQGVVAYLVQGAVEYLARGAVAYPARGVVAYLALGVVAYLARVCGCHSPECAVPTRSGGRYTLARVGHTHQDERGGQEVSMQRLFSYILEWHMN